MAFRRLACLLGIWLSIEQAFALPVLIRHVPAGTFGGFPELAALSIFTTAIIFLFAGAFVMSIVTEAQAMAVLRNLRHNAISRLHRLHGLSPFAAFDGNGRAPLLPRHIPARRGGLAYPMASRARHHPRQGYHASPV